MAIKTEMKARQTVSHETMQSKECRLYQQRNAMKLRHKDAIFIMRNGDFYELYEEDAVIASDNLAITLKNRVIAVNGETKHFAIAGFPHHALDYYLPKLVRAGYRVCICEPLPDEKD